MDANKSTSELISTVDGIMSDAIGKSSDALGSIASAIEVQHRVIERLEDKLNKTHDVDTFTTLVQQRRKFYALVDARNALNNLANY